MAIIFSGSGEIPLASIICPKKGNRFIQKVHFSKLSLSLAFLILVNTSQRYWIWFLNVSKNTLVSSK